MSQPAVEGALAEQLVDHQQSGLVSPTAAGTCSPTLGGFTPAASDAEGCERREAGTAVVAALPPASPQKLEVLDLTSSHNRMPLMDLSVKPKLVNQVPPASPMLPSAVLETSRSTSSNHLEPLSSSGSFHTTSRNNNSKCVISINSSSALGNSTCASSGDDHSRNTVDLAAGLITIDTSSLSSIDATPMTSFQCRSGIQKSNKVTAQGTIIPPLANSIQDSGILQDSSSSSSVGPISNQSAYSSKSQVCSTSQDQLNRQADLYDSQFHLESPNSEQDRKNSSRLFLGNSSSKLTSVNYSKASSEPNNSVFINGHDQPGNSSSTSLPASTSSSPCHVSPASSPSCELQGSLPSGAGCEVKGMPAIPVSAVPNHLKDHRESSAVHVDANDGGRLTFFKEGKLLLELSHRSAGDRGSSNKDGKKSSGVWVQIESNTFWPPPSCRANISTPLHFPFPGCGKSARRKQYTPRRCEVHGGDSLAGGASDAAARPRDVPCDPFLFVCSPLVRACRKSMVCRVQALARSPHLRSLMMDDIPVDERGRRALLGSQTLRRRSSYLMNSSADGDRIRRKHRIENFFKILAERYNLSIDYSLKVGQIFERVMLKTPSPNSFVSPRKRYLKQLESDHETQGKKKALMTNSNCTGRSSSYTPESYQNYQCSKVLNARLSALNNTGGAHTIDSILNNPEKRNESYLKSLLKSEGKRSPHSSSRSPLTMESVKQEPEALVCVKPDRDLSWTNNERSAPSWNSNFEKRSSRDSEERRPQPAYSSSPHCRSSPPSPRTPRQSHPPAGVAAPSTSAAKNGSAVAPELPYPGPGYALSPQQALSSLYPSLYDPSYFFINGVNPLAAGGLINSHHSQMAVAAAAAAAAAASISSISSYGLAPIQLSALAATQYSNLLNSALNPVAFAAAAAASSPLSPNLAAPLTPALTPGAATLPTIPPVNPSTLPSALSPGMSLSSVVASHPSFLTASHQARNSPYPTPSPHPRSPFSPTSKLCYPPSRSPHSRPRSPPSKSSSMYAASSSPYPPRKPQQALPHHHPQPALPPSSPWRPAAAHHRPPPPTLSSSQDTPLNLTKPRCQ